MTHARSRLDRCSTAVGALLIALGGFAPAPALAWWNCAWSSRVALDVSAAAAGTNVIVEAALPASALPGYPWTAADTSLRVVDADDSTVLPHFAEPRPGSVQRLRVWFRVPAVGPTPRRVWLYYGNTAAASTATSAIFTAAGVRQQSRQLTATSHASLAAFLAQFDAASSPAGYGCTVLPSYVNRSNGNVFGAAANIHFSTMFFLDVPASQTGNWRFRLGPDYGLGGALYVNSTALEQAWGTDLWWANDFTDSGQILAGTISLAAGRHLVYAYGSEACCDGAQSMQVDLPGGGTNWIDVTTANLSIVAPSCPVAGLATVRVADDAVLRVAQAVATISDPIAGTANAKSIPSARKRYSVTVRDAGNARAIDSNTVAIAVPVPPNTRLFVRDLGAAGSGPVQFVNGTPSSGLTYAFTSLASATDDLEFSDDGGGTWTYVPTPDANGADGAVTHVRVRPKGQPTCTATATPGSFELRFDVVVR